MNWLEQIAGLRLYSGQGLSLGLWVVAGLAGLFFVVFWYDATRRIVSDRWRRILTGIRIAALVFLVLYLVNPVLSYRRREVIKGKVAIAIDTSESMSIADSVGGRRRFEAVKDLLTGRDSSLIKTLTNRGDVHLYRFDRTAWPITEAVLGQLKEAEGEASDLASVLDRIAGDHAQENFLAAVVFSDGQVNVRADPLSSLSKLPIPVHTVGLGQIEETRTRRADVALVIVDANPVATKDVATVARVRFRQHGFDGGLFPIALTEGDTQIATQTVAAEDVARQEIELRFTPRDVGVHNYEVFVPEQPNEAVAENNRLRFSVLVNETTFRVLYIEGSLRWEYKYLKRLLEQDPTIEARTMVRTGAEHFLTSGRGTVTMRDGFPASLEELAKFRIVILGDLPSRFWSAEQLTMLEEFVSERDGGLLLLGGTEMFSSGNYRNTSIEKMMPAEFVSIAPVAAESGQKLVITEQGRRSEILEGLNDAIAQLDLRRYYPLGKAKPAAEVLLQAPDRSPLLVAQPYGKGRVVALATDSFWRAVLGPRKPGESTAAEQVWRQLLQWLGGIEPGAGDDGRTLVANTDRTHYEAGRPIVVRARVNRKALPGGRVDVEARFRIDGREVGRVPLRPDNREIEHSGSFEPPRDGQYEIEVALEAGNVSEQVTLHVTTGSPYRELEQTTLNESLLRTIAAQSGGRYFTIANAAEIAAQLQREKTVREDRIEREWRASPVIFALFAAMLSAEWYLRRRKSLI